MTIRAQAAQYRLLRQGPVWKLLAADTAPETLAILEALLCGEEREVPASVFLERLVAAEQEVNDRPMSREQARVLAGDWIREGYLTLRLVEGRNEETYELTSAGQEAIRALARFQSRRTGPSESRLELVTHAIERLAADSDPESKSRIAQLEAEKARIDEEINDIREGRSPSISETAALDRVIDILDLVGELEADFRRVREEFERLSHEFRERILRSAASRGVILDSFFDGVNGISESEAGRAFEAFYRLLTDNRESQELEAALERLAGRSFYDALAPSERDRISNLQRRLLARARNTHTVMTSLAKALREFVRTRAYAEEHRLGALIQQARTAALETRKRAGMKESFIDFTLSSAEIRSIDQYELDDPEETFMEDEIGLAQASDVNALSVLECILAAEINTPALMRAVEARLTAPGAPERVSIGEVYSSLEIQQGLGSVVGLLALATKHGEPGGPGMPSELLPAEPPRVTRKGSDAWEIPEPLPAVEETLGWTDRLGSERHARIPLYWFTMKSLERMRESSRWR